MSIIEKILTLDEQFLQMNNQLFIDDGLAILDDFSNKRDELIKELETAFSSEEYTISEKKDIFNKLSKSTTNVTSKFKEIRSQINNLMAKSNLYQKAYQPELSIEGSFFVDKLV